jgi:anti-sigma B factor antagonist
MTAGDPFDITVRCEPGTVILCVTGECDLYTANQLEDALNAALRESQPMLIIDATKLTFLDSRGLSVLVRAWTAAPERATTMQVVGATRGVRRVFEITGLAAMLDA